MFLTLMRPSLVLFLVLWLKLVKDFLKVRCRLALLPFLISCLIWLDLVASLPLIKERILVIILLLHFLSLKIGRASCRERVLMSGVGGWVGKGNDILEAVVLNVLIVECSIIVCRDI